MANGPAAVDGLATGFNVPRRAFECACIFAHVCRPLVQSLSEAAAEPLRYHILSIQALGDGRAQGRAHLRSRQIDFGGYSRQQSAHGLTPLGLSLKDRSWRPQQHRAGFADPQGSEPTGSIFNDHPKAFALSSRTGADRER